MRTPVFPFTLFILFSVLVPLSAYAADGSLRGHVTDQLGDALPSAQLTLRRDGREVSRTTTDDRGDFAFTDLPEGRYTIDATAPSFAPTTTDAVYVAGHASIDIRLNVGDVSQHVIVTASADAVPEAQVGAAVSVLDNRTIVALGNSDLLEPLRTIPGAAVVQNGGRGGTASVFVRGGASNFAKVLIDGVPANDIGGAFDFADLQTTAVDGVEVLRGANSVLFGSDALSGVINITTKRGKTTMPEATFAVDGGNLATSHEDASLGGMFGRVDYFTAFAHLQTDNSVPNNAYRNNTSASRVGAVAGNTAITGTLRYIDTALGSPNAFDYDGIADDSSQKRQSTYGAVSGETQWTSRLASTVRFAISHQDYNYVNPSPTGQRSDPSAFANYLGNVVTITGANGYTVAGRAILDYGGTYPSLFNSAVTRRLLSGDVSDHLASGFDLAAGVRVENENGTAGTSSTSRTNSGAFVEARSQWSHRVFVNAGIGFDDNAIFGAAWTPRVSAAVYVADETKLTANAGKGIKEPNVSQELSSLFDLVPAAQAASLGITPIGPERSRSVDVGIEQGIAHERGRVSLTYFNNAFDNLIEYVSKNVLPQLGVPPAAATATGFGAYVNSQSNTSSGIELSGEARLQRVRLLGSYTYLDATVTKSFGSGALSPAFNPLFPGIPIGQYSPLVGNRPFRRPTNSGSLVAIYSDPKLTLSIAGYFVGKRDDSTLLTDEFFGTSLLLPNQDMDAAYQKFDVSASYQIHPRLRWYATIENAFDKKYEAVAGFPALPRTIQTGVSVRVGGK